MGKDLFKLHGLYFSANITDTTQISQSEVTQMEPRGSTTGSGNKIGEKFWNNQEEQLRSIVSDESPSRSKVLAQKLIYKIECVFSTHKSQLTG